MQRGDRHFTLPLSRPRDRGGLTTDEESLAFGHGRRSVAHNCLPLYDVTNSVLQRSSKDYVQKKFQTMVQAKQWRDTFSGKIWKGSEVTVEL